jgi:hypothetical protein
LALNRNVVREQSFSFARRGGNLAKYQQRKEAVFAGQFLRGEKAIAVREADSSIDRFHQPDHLIAAEFQSIDTDLQEASRLLISIVKSSRFHPKTAFLSHSSFAMPHSP